MSSIVKKEYRKWVTAVFLSWCAGTFEFECFFTDLTIIH